jgi:hypothetical protein
MPRKWEMHWPLPDGVHAESDRDHLIHTLGNLTLLTGRLNAKVSNGPWLGTNGKRLGLEAHDVLMLNRDLLKKSGDWTDPAIRARTDELSKIITEIWPVPPGHKSGFSHEKVGPRHKVDLSDLISAGALVPGTLLYPRRKNLADRVATVLPDGRLDIQGTVYASPSEASKAIIAKNTAINGWWFFLVDQPSKRSLQDVRRDYLESFAVEIEEDDMDDDDDDA